MPKIIHVPFCYYPDPVGGTEIYVAGLAHALQNLGLENIIAAPSVNSANSRYCHAGLPVRRFSLSTEKSKTILEELYGEGDPVAAAEFANILDEEQPDLVHLHAFTRGCSLRTVRAAKSRQIPVVFTYHTPTISCQRGTLLRWGNEICDGVLHRHTCTACTLNSFGLNLPLSHLLGALPPQVGNLLGLAGFSGGPWTALRMTQLVEMRQAAFRALVTESNQVVVLCQWAKELLLNNDVPEHKLILSRHGLNVPSPNESRLGTNSNTDARHNSNLRIAFLGRLHPTKGIDLVINALKLNPQLAVELDIYGISQVGPEDDYSTYLHTQANNDPRISFKSPIPADKVISVLKDYDLLAVPSRWLETGPLVVLEAFTAGVPVIGSKLGGIAELVQHEVNGLLVEPESVEAWGQAIQRCITNPNVLAQLKTGISQPKSMSQVALEMQALYQKLILN